MELLEHLQRPRIVVGGLLVGQHLRRLLAGRHGVALMASSEVLGLGGQAEAMGERAEDLGPTRPPPAPYPPDDAAGPGCVGDIPSYRVSRISMCEKASSDRTRSAGRLGHQAGS